MSSNSATLSYSICPRPLLHGLEALATVVTDRHRMEPDNDGHSDLLRCRAIRRQKKPSEKRIALARTAYPTLASKPCWRSLPLHRTPLS